MQIREDTITVTEANLQRTDRDCRACEDGTFLKDGHELVCGSCGYAPSSDGPTRKTTPWDAYRSEVDLRASGEVDGRPRLPGGWPDAYWGEGEYEYDPESGFRF